MEGDHSQEQVPKSDKPASGQQGSPKSGIQLPMRIMGDSEGRADRLTILSFIFAILPLLPIADVEMLSSAARSIVESKRGVLKASGPSNVSPKRRDNRPSGSRSAKTETTKTTNSAPPSRPKSPPKLKGDEARAPVPEEPKPKTASPKRKGKKRNRSSANRIPSKEGNETAEWWSKHDLVMPRKVLNSLVHTPSGEHPKLGAVEKASLESLGIVLAQIRDKKEVLPTGVGSFLSQMVRKVPSLGLDSFEDILPPSLQKKAKPNPEVDEQMDHN